MSSNISTPVELSSRGRQASGTCWRVVEAQNHVSTIKLTDNQSEQALLEEIIEASKPTLPVECEHLHYLLSTPFRYGAPYPKGSRFRRPGMTAGVFYASDHVETAIAESAFWRLVFYAESPTTPWPRNPGEYTAFACEYASSRTIDLTRPPFDENATNWTHPTAYEACQNLCDAARAEDFDVIRYESVRDPRQRANVAILSCRAFSRTNEVARQTWRIHLSANGARTRCEMPSQTIEFDRAVFKNDPRISTMKWDR